MTLNIQEHKFLRFSEIESLNSSELEELLIKGHHLENIKVYGYAGSVYSYAVNVIGIDTMDLQYFPQWDSWGLF